jgi:opacity protein-like surface antigen
MVIAAPAFAGGYVAPSAPAPVAPAPAPVSGTDWSGFYGGVQADYFAGDATSGGVNSELTGQLIGVFAGYRYDIGSIVIGGEVDYMIGSGTLTVFGTDTDFDFNYLLRAGVEVGYDLDQMLAYASLGYVDTELEATPFAPVSGDGIYVGVGFDYMVSDSMTVGVETNYHRFEDFNGVAGQDINAVTVGANLAFRF